MSKETTLTCFSCHVESFSAFFPKEKFFINDQEFQYGHLLISVNFIEVLGCILWNGTYYTLETNVFDQSENKSVFLGIFENCDHWVEKKFLDLSTDSSEELKKDCLVSVFKHFFLK